MWTYIRKYMYMFRVCIMFCVYIYICVNRCVMYDDSQETRSGGVPGPSFAWDHSKTTQGVKQNHK